ncbi:MAG: hypothetical protein KAR19_14630 [Bacteroidales bacterium]|nr:hypothetical protein [Bacteroidales bacterium]
MFGKYIQPSIEVWNIRIDEPITAFTDLLLAAVCFYAFIRIRQQDNRGRIRWYFKNYFLTLGLASLFGGLVGHAFLYSFAPQWKLVSWVFILFSVALIAHALLDIARPLVGPVFTKFVFSFNLLVLVLALFFTVWTGVFSPVKYYTIFGMLIVVGSLSFYIFQKTSSRGAVRFMVAVGLGLVSAFVFSYEWGFGPWFNHNDVCHVILSFSAIIIYKGAALILESPVHLV